MIDEDWLREALRDVADTIEVPVDGPDRVLAARDGLRNGRTQKRISLRAIVPGRRPTVRAAVVALAVVVVFAGIGVAVVRGVRAGHSHHVASRGPGGFAPAPSSANGSGAAGSDSGASASGANGFVNQSGATGAAGSGAVAAGPGAAGGGAGSVGAGPGASAPVLGPAAPYQGVASSAATATTNSGPALPSLPSRVVKTGDVQVVVARGKLSASVDQLSSLATGLGGYVADTKAAEGGDSPTADVTLTIPVDHFNTAIAQSRALGRSTSVTTTSKDVTADLVDLDARIHALQSTRDQFLQILARAYTIGDILAVQQQISGTETQIEQLQGQQRVLDSQASYSTLAVHLSEPGSPPARSPRPPSGVSKAWTHARHSFAHGFESVIGWLGGFAVFAVCVIFLLFAGRLSWNVIRSRIV